MAGELKEFPQVPIVGQPCEFIGLTMQSTIICKCPANRIVSIPGLGISGECPSCGRRWIIDAVQYKFGQPAMGVNIRLVQPAADPALPRA